MNRFLGAVAAAAIALGSFGSATMAGPSSGGRSSSPSPSYSRPSSPSPSYSKPSSPSPSISKPTPAPEAPRVASPPPSNQGYSKPSFPSGVPSGLAIGAAGVAAGAATASKPASAEPAHSSESHSATDNKSTTSNSGYSKPGASPSTTSAPVASTPPSNQGYSKPSTQPAATASAPPPKPVNSLGVAASKSVSSDALAKYRAERAEAKAPPQPVDAKTIRRDPVFADTRKEYGSVENYMNHRSRTIVVYRDRYPNMYNYNVGMSPNYGMFDSNFLMGVMLGYLGGSHTNNAAWMYAHQNDPWYPRWRADMERQAQTNADLRAKIASMDEEMARIRAQKDPPKVTALPEGVDKSIAIAPEAVMTVAKHDDDEDSSNHAWMWVLLVTALLGFGTLGYFYYVGKNK